jgi:hypothetical protein
VSIGDGRPTTADGRRPTAPRTISVGFLTVLQKYTAGFTTVPRTISAGFLTVLQKYTAGFTTVPRKGSAGSLTAPRKIRRGFKTVPRKGTAGFTTVPRKIRRGFKTENSYRPSWYQRFCVGIKPRRSASGRGAWKGAPQGKGRSDCNQEFMLT